MATFSPIASAGNLWTQFRRLLPSEAEFIGTVTYVNEGEGWCLVELPDGATMKVWGSAQVDDVALIRAGEVVTSGLPSLATYTVEV